MLDIRSFDEFIPNKIDGFSNILKIPINDMKHSSILLTPHWGCSNNYIIQKFYSY